MFYRLGLKLQQTMVEMFPLTSEDAAYNKFKGTLSTVGDPFTRIISPKVFFFVSGSSSNLKKPVRRGHHRAKRNYNKPRVTVGRAGNGNIKTEHTHWRATGRESRATNNAESTTT
ncbi:hypothetical protein ABFX02_13G033700 [Erythranthe guttata]